MKRRHILVTARGNTDKGQVPRPRREELWKDRLSKDFRTLIADLNTCRGLQSKREFCQWWSCRVPLNCVGEMGSEQSGIRRTGTARGRRGGWRGRDQPLAPPDPALPARDPGARLADVPAREGREWAVVTFGSSNADVRGTLCPRSTDVVVISSGRSSVLHVAVRMCAGRWRLAYSSPNSCCGIADAPRRFPPFCLRASS